MMLCSLTVSGHPTIRMIIGQVPTALAVGAGVVFGHFYPPLFLSSPFAVPGRVAQSVGHLTRKSGVLGSIPGLATIQMMTLD